ncbi:MAG: hypothetical protein NTX25_13015, partial [Proteobacteria bacterium]|nr:hypothetical protein [Pseudomonadota bacterium]
RYRANIDAVTDGGLNYQWSQLSGPGLVSFSSAKSEDTSVVASQAGNYELQLLVTDQAGNSASDRLLVSFANELKVYAKHLSAGGSQTCSVLDDDSLSCWGYNFEGELGYGDSKDRYRTASFGINLGPHKTALHVATAYDHSCAILNDHSVKCWGQNAYGQLGYGDTTNRMAPPAQSINLGDNRTATAIFTGFSHSCAILDDDSVKCWGANGSGQLGLGDYVNRMAPPMQAIKLGPNRYARSLSLGAYHSCALLDDYSVKCWGNNSEAQLGYTDKVQRASPAINPLFFGGAQKVLSLVSGDYHSCAILDDMSLRCWGRNTDGQLGLGDTAPHLALAESKLSFAEGLHPQSLTAGLSHTCVLFDDGSVQCWGQNDEGQLGYGDTEQRYAPSASPLLMGEGRLAIALTAGRKHTCALLDDKTLKCWGSNSYGQLGNGQVSNLPAVPIKALEYENRPSI